MTTETMNSKRHFSVVTEDGTTSYPNGWVNEYILGRSITQVEQVFDPYTAKQASIFGITALWWAVEAESVVYDWWLQMINLECDYSVE